MSKYRNSRRIQILLYLDINLEWVLVLLLLGMRPIVPHTHLYDGRGQKETLNQNYLAFTVEWERGINRKALPKNTPIASIYIVIHFLTRKTPTANTSLF